ncbi:ATP-dependent DNA helicase [Wohlfahrtiimonas chitiniclastica]|uniref:ATP-dependent DNA helicase n=1 Tax=Wohlfahrtiimonas chitiniclastica TaxID=400946 RepID=UPI001FEE53E6|nr:ATP-dependent RecD-like DNA helicase [Wohlfahrtiimonas chitiniclastica]
MDLQEILVLNENICKNIKSIEVNGRGFGSQNILPQLRTLVEVISVAILVKKGGVHSSRNYEDIKVGIKHLRSNGEYKNLRKFYDLLQKSVSHYIVCEGSSERLMLKYYEYLLKLKDFMYKEFNLVILENISEFPLNLDPQLSEYYEKIAYEIDKHASETQFGDRYYIHKIKPFFVNQKIYYEISFVIATNNTSKFERVIAFTNIDIMSNYSVRLSLYKKKIDVLNRSMEIWIINDWEISIRPCEIANFSKIFNKNITGTHIEDRALMVWLKNENIDLVELINSNNDYYMYIRNNVVKDKVSTQFFYILDLCRKLVKGQSKGQNIIQYLLYRMNNSVIKKQYANNSCSLLSGLFLQFGCIPFDTMPFATSPIGHNPRLFDLLACFDIQGRDHELFARQISQNNEIERILFTKKSDITYADNIDSLISRFNSCLYLGTENQRKRRLREFYEHIYIESYVDDCVEILDSLAKLTQIGLSNYSQSMTNWLSSTSRSIDCLEKKEILKELFINSHIAIIYGAAGTGKSTLISHIAEYFSEKNKLFLTNTNTAKSNLERRVKVEKCSYQTITKFLNSPIATDILFIDEASTISNRDMKSILQKADFRLLILVGDNYQIEAIRFGNWFDIVKDFVPTSAVHELKNTYRSTNKNLLNLWDNVRKIDNSILESLLVREITPYSQKLDDSIFDKSEEDEIILCLNYDGLYGINNINRLLQEANVEKSISWGINTYKVGDPILFNDSIDESNILYNNMKGVIKDFIEEGGYIYFTIEIDAVLDESDFWYTQLEFVSVSPNGNAIIKFSIESIINTDEDDLYNKKTMPFQIAYAISIHKAQGLEYESVKVVINNEVDEAITHNIFYTAITRAKSKLKIYWSPESEKQILDGFKRRDHGKDIALLRKYKAST